MTTEETFFKDRLNVIKFLKSLRTYMEIYDEDDDEMIMLNTRDNGDVGSEEIGDEDLQEAIRVKKRLSDEYPHLIVNIEEVDEWVHLTIKPKALDKFRYAFIKRDEKGCGFTETFNTIDELIKRYGDWVEVNWNGIISQLDSIVDYPNNRFTGWYDSRDVLLSKQGSKGNKWGYSFYVKKSKYNSDY